MKYYNRKETPLKFHNFFRFVMIPLSIYGGFKLLFDLNSLYETLQYLTTVPANCTGLKYLEAFPAYFKLIYWSLSILLIVQIFLNVFVFI